jgi:cobalt-zinc-cadmium resistance protein CzcA
MIARLIEISLRQRLFLLIVAGVSVVLGLWSAWHLPIDAVPDITSPQVQVNTEVPALAPEETELSVTIPLETELAGIQGVVEMRSLTKFGLSQVTLLFGDGADIYRARQLVAERLQTVSDRLPPGLTPKLAPISTGLGEIFYYTLGYRADATNRPPTRFAQLLELHELHSSSSQCFELPRASPKSTPTAATKNSSSSSRVQRICWPPAFLLPNWPT